MILHPIRTKILRSLQEANSAKELGRILGLKPTKLYYHIALLERHGLLTVFDSRMIGNLEERRYICVAKDFSIDLKEEGEGDEGLDTLEQGIAAAFPTARAEMLASYRALMAEKKERKAAAARGEESGPEPPKSIFTVSQKELRLDAEGQRALSAKLDELAASMESETGEAYSLLYAIYPSPKEGK